MRTRLLKNFSLALCAGIALFSAAERASGQLSVGPTGLAPQALDTLPPAAEWSQRSVAGAAGDITTSGALDTAVQANTAALTTAALVSSNANPPNATGAGIWSTSGYIQTRPTG